MTDEPEAGETRVCPYCAETVDAVAVTCKYCGSALVRACPFCAETVRAEAIKCRHCGSAISPVAGSSGAAGGGPALEPVAHDNSVHVLSASAILVNAPYEEVLALLPDAAARIEAKVAYGSAERGCFVVKASWLRQYGEQIRVAFRDDRGRGIAMSVEPGSIWTSAKRCEALLAAFVDLWRARHPVASTG